MIARMRYMDKSGKLHNRIRFIDDDDLDAILDYRFKLLRIYSPSDRFPTFTSYFKHQTLPLESQNCGYSKMLGELREAQARQQRLARLQELLG